ncbi:MAG: LysR family transcriptional regulator [Xanthomonadaceae bacterium]|nr:LysR family transcriptional regulator [Xanthomonadaceae bacterium]
MRTLNSFDLNLLFIVESLYRTLNVSKTASELGMSQSAVSHALAKVRDHFKDPMFVRIAKGVRPTDTAKELRSIIEDFVISARELSSHHKKLDPATMPGRIRIATTDYAEVVLMPSLLRRLKKEAPHLQISIHPTGGALPKMELENGIYDLAIAGFYEKLPEGFYQAKVLEDSFSTAYRKDHSAIHEEIKTKQYFELDHALITLQGDFKDKITKVIGGKKRIRNIVFGSYSFTGLAWTIAESDLVLTAPTLLLDKYKKYFPIQVQKCPISIPNIEIKMVWHGLTHRDPAKIWIRDLIKTEFANVQSR